MHRNRGIAPLETMEPRMLFSASVTGDGLINRDYWQDIGGSSITDLTTSGDYPRYPNGSDQLTSLQAVDWGGSGQTSDWLNSYGQKIAGYIVAPETGTYTFWVSGDDNAQLFLSTDSSTGNKSLIADVPGYTYQLEWDKYTSQKSADITLQAGEFYYIEMLHKEGGGGDHLAVGWRKPSDGAGTIPAEIVPSSALSSVLPLSAQDNQVTRDYWTGIPDWPTYFLKVDPDYPHNPDGSDTLTSLQAISWDSPSRDNNLAEEYGQRIHGYIVAPETGGYTFWVSGDDQSEF
ncbi:MAG: PA14 domain-containing protein [Planctomycetota bacterium]